MYEAKQKQPLKRRNISLSLEKELWKKYDIHANFKYLRASVDDKLILKGLDLEVNQGEIHA